MTAVEPAHGTLVKIGDGGSPESFTTVAEVRTISGPTLEREQIDVTNMDSTDSWREFINGLKVGGEITLGLNYLPTNATHNASAGLLSKLDSATSSTNFQLVMSDSSTTTWTLPCNVSRFAPNFDPAAQIDASVTLKVAGKPTLA